MYVWKVNFVFETSLAVQSHCEHRAGRVLGAGLSRPQQLPSDFHQTQFASNPKFRVLRLTPINEEETSKRFNPV